VIERHGFHQRNLRLFVLGISLFPGTRKRRGEEGAGETYEEEGGRLNDKQVVVNQVSIHSTRTLAHTLGR